MSGPWRWRVRRAAGLGGVPPQAAGTVTPGGCGRPAPPHGEGLGSGNGRREYKGTGLVRPWAADPVQVRVDEFLSTRRQRS